METSLPKEIDLSSLMVYSTGEKYDCPKSLNALTVTFPSLQCEMRACGGDINNKKNLDNMCKSCDNYVINARERDWEWVDKPL